VQSHKVPPKTGSYYPIVENCKKQQDCLDKTQLILPESLQRLDPMVAWFYLSPIYDLMINKVLLATVELLTHYSPTEYTVPCNQTTCSSATLSLRPFITMAMFAKHQLKAMYTGTYRLQQIKVQHFGLMYNVRVIYYLSNLTTTERRATPHVRPLSFIN
jgi:hypothetical protein